jgi:hypothetical protein
VKLSQWPRHLPRHGDRLWVSLGTATDEIAVLDRLELRRHVRPAFLAHDVGVSLGGRVWITPAEPGPQHVTFGAGRAFVTNGSAGTLHVHDERSRRVLRTTELPLGSYNVQRLGGRIVSPSLASGTLCVLDVHGRLLHRVHVGESCHDAA